MAGVSNTSYILFDTESVVDGALMARVLYPGESLSAADAISRYREESGKGKDGDDVFIPVTFHVPVALGFARLSADFRLLELGCLDAPKFDPQTMVRLFWKGVQVYSKAALVDFNGRGFDLPLLTLSAFRFGISCPRYFADPDRMGFRYRFTPKHIDLMDWITEYGAFRLKGGLNLLAKLLGKPGKMGTKGDQVEMLYNDGKIQEINDYCLHDVLDTYFIFLRTRVLAGQITLDEEQKIVAGSKDWLKEKSLDIKALEKYLDGFGTWNPEPFR